MSDQDEEPESATNVMADPRTDRAPGAPKTEAAFPYAIAQPRSRAASAGPRLDGLPFVPPVAQPARAPHDHDPLEQTLETERAPAGPPLPFAATPTKKAPPVVGTGTAPIQQRPMQPVSPSSPASELPLGAAFLQALGRQRKD